VFCQNSVKTQSNPTQQPNGYLTNYPDHTFRFSKPMRFL